MGEAHKRVDLVILITDEIFAGRRISFLDAMLKDQPGTHWMYDHQTGTLFTADAFGYLFPVSADQQLDDEMENGIPMDWLRRYHEAAFRFLKLSSADRVIADFDRVFSNRDVSVIALPTSMPSEEMSPNAAAVSTMPCGNCAR